MKKKINIGIIGSGKITNEYLKIIRTLKSFNLEGITSKTNKNSFKMAEAMKYAVIAGRKSYLSGRIEKIIYGKASSPDKGII